MPETPAAAAAPGGRNPMAEFRDRLIQQLKLTEDQIGKVDGIFAGARPQFAALRELAEKDRPKARERIMVELRYPIMQKSLRSGLEGWQYYRAVLEGTIDDLDRLRRYVHFDFVYSSACPCSAELNEHARDQRVARGLATRGRHDLVRIAVRHEDGHVAVGGAGEAVA